MRIQKLLALGAFVFLSGTRTSNEAIVDLAISNVNIIDMQSGAIRTGMDVLIRRDTIIEIVAHVSGRSDSKRTVDGTGKFLIPGLWDMHTHTHNSYREFFPMQLANGITGIREMFGDPEKVRVIREEIRQGKIDGPIVISSGPIIDGNPPTWGSSAVAETPEQGRAIVRKQKEQGADFIKVYFNLKRDVFLAIADEARRQNLPVVGHLPNRVSLPDAVEAGMKSFEHFWNILEYYSDQKGLADIEARREGRFAGDAFYDRYEYGLRTFDSTRTQDAIQLLKKDNVWICPTFTVHKGFQRDYDPEYVNDPRMKFMSEKIVSWWMTNKKKVLTELQIQHWNADKLWYQRVVAECRKYKSAGVRFLAGTDSPNFFVYPGFSLHEELEIFVNEVGFTPLEALQTATIQPAQFFGLSGKVGRVERGMLANLVLLRANPLEDIRNSRAIEGVVLSGRYKSKSEMMDVEIK